MQLTSASVRNILIPSIILGIFCQISSTYSSIRLKSSDEPAPFYLDPVGLDTGIWSEWGPRSQCSKLCNGGVSHEQRTCLSDSAKGCTGPRRRYYACSEAEECPEDAVDFRTEQCRKFDDTPYQGQLYRWTPYKKGSNKCELLCRPENGSFYVSFAPHVIDGTECNDEGTSVCIRGKCVSMGCDKRLGSHLQEDKCRVCGGDGTSCKFVEGLYDDTDVPESSYAEFLVIPAGSTNVQIRERRPSENYIAMRSVNGEYLLNGDFKVESGMRTIRAAGTTFVYHRESKMHPSAELLTAPGPTTGPIVIAILHQETNPGILYEFYAPKVSKDVVPLSFTWLARSYGPCSKSCGEGQQSRLVSCVRTTDYESVEDHHCDATSKPHPVRRCHVDACPAFWKIGEWETCSVPCGGGSQYRSVVCVQAVGELRNVVNNTLCKSEIQFKPEVMRACNQFKCPEWTVSDWSACSAPCGPGVQKRSVTCKSRNPADQVQQLSEAACSTVKKPTKSQPCLIAPCEGLEWAVSDWTGCNSCGQSRRTRQAVCTSLSGEVFPPALCENIKKPELSSACPDSPPCDARWFSTEWSKCSTSCGEGEKTREVFCGTTDDSDSAQITRVSTDLCDVEQKLPDRMACNDDLACDGQWFTGPFMACSARCGGGTKRRHVSCLKKGKVVSPSECDEDRKPADSEDCNKVACDKEGFVPMNGCANTKFGCCPDGDTEAEGLNFKGCPANDAPVTCGDTEFGCCADNETIASGPSGGGCNVSDVVITVEKVNVVQIPRARQAAIPPPDESPVLGENDTLNGNVTAGNHTILANGTVLCSDGNMVNSTEDCSLDEDLDNSTLSLNNSTLEVDNSTLLATQPIILIGSGNQNLTLNDTLDSSGSLNDTDIDAGNSTLNETLDATSGLNATDIDASNSTLNDTLDASAGLNATDSDIDNLALNETLDATSGLNDTDVGDLSLNEPLLNDTDCWTSQWGCCVDNCTAATGPDGLGCEDAVEGSGDEPAASCKPPRMKAPTMEQGECKDTDFGCCADGQTGAVGPNGEGCPERDCALSEYGCCPDGLTLAYGPAYEECPHLKQPKQTCELSHDQGSCRNYSVKWYYDTDYGDCNRFWYGGCEGNENKFDGEDECKGECVSPVHTAVCGLPKVRGPCDQSLRMWYYDKYVRECLPFHYGGCLGNNNRFESREDCNERCVETQVSDVCQQPVRVGNCPASLPRWYFDAASGRCSQFLYGGCGGNGNRFGSDDQCLKKCGGETGGESATDICILEKAEGDCKDNYPRYYFDRNSRTCQQFIYTGCNGNENKFDSIEECEGRCRRYLYTPQLPEAPVYSASPAVDPRLAHCHEAAERGHCESNLPRWHYDATDGVCKRFSYSGCGGNKNNFDSQVLCINECSAAQDHCTLPKVVGPCRGAFNVFFFDKYERRCVPFTYGGCQGNGNRFQTNEECERNCSRLAEVATPPPVYVIPHTISPSYTAEQSPYLAICSMGVDAGACDERIPRYYYDISQGKCLSFTYTGCGGNQNHFHTLEQCEGFCSQFGVGCPVRTCDNQCPYGYENDPSSCPTCRCVEPCRDTQCPAYAVCQVTTLPNGEHIGTCASRLERPGTCPSLEDIPPGSCSRDCGTDNDCGGLQKCCNNGCGTSCMTPSELVADPLVTTLATFVQAPIGGGPYAAYISSTLSDIRSELGQTVTLPCAAHGDPEPQVFWQHNNHTVRSDDTHYIQRDHELIIHGVRADDAGDYICTANNGIGPSVEHRLRLNIESVVRIDGGDDVASVRAGDRAILKCSAHGVPQPRISWSKGGEALPRESAKYRQTADDSLVIESVTVEDQNVYICTADNGVHTPSIKNVVLRIHEEIKAQIVAQSSNFQTGSTIRLDCHASGFPQPRVRWYLNAQEIVSDGDRSQVFSNGTLIVKKLRAADAGVYQCQANNEHTTASDSLRVFVTGSQMKQDCTDNGYYANCGLIVQAELCNNQYYQKFCCKSCTEAGQLRANRRRRRRREISFSY